MRHDLLRIAEVVASVAAAAAVVHLLTMAVLRRLAGRAGPGRDVVERCRRPVMLLVASLVALAGVRAGADPGGDPGTVDHVVVLVVIAAVAWTLIALAGAGSDLVARRFDVRSPDNLRARRVHTQAAILRRVAAVIIVVVAGAAMLTTFPGVRTLGASLLASAGIAGVVIGIAAQGTLGNLIAGIQIALTEPIRLDDVVVIEGQYGRIEEVTFTYVVVALWDQRRMVLPISYFTTTPFENWTRSQSQITGAVNLHVDHAVPMDELRAELARVLERSPLWDGRSGGLQMVDSHAQTVEVRALVSARDASSAWDLRCDVREALVAYLRERRPEGLPRVRTEIGTDAAVGAAA